MKSDFFPQYPDTSRIWIYGFEKPLSSEDLAVIHTNLGSYTKSWKSHGRAVDGDYMMIENRFLVLAISEKDTVSGCSIDSSVRILEKLRDQYGLDALNVNLVFFRDHTSIRAVPRKEFRELLDAGRILLDTDIFDFSVQKLGELRRDNFYSEFSRSWAAKVFPVASESV